MQRSILTSATCHIAKRPGQDTGIIIEKPLIEFIRGQLARQLTPMVKSAMTGIEFKAEFLQPMPVAISLLRKKFRDGQSCLPYASRLEKPGNVQL